MDDHRVNRLMALAESLQGELLPDAAAVLGQEDWADYYPIVTRDGRLTGEIAAADGRNIDVADYYPGRGMIVSQGASEAAMWREKEET